MTQAKLQPKATVRAEGSSTPGLLRLAGYGLLILGAFDVVASFVPPLFTNPDWEFQLVGALVERSVVPLLGLVLAFYGEWDGRSRVERAVLPLLSWGALLGGIAYLMLIPLGVVNAWRIDQNNVRQITSQVTQRMGGITQAKQQISKANKAQLDAAFNVLKKRGAPADIRNPQDLKKKASQNIATLENQIGTQSEQAQANLRVNLLKNSTKWNLGALVSGVLFVLVWRSSRWARRRAA